MSTVAAVALTGACKVDVDVAIDADSRGGGVLSAVAHLDAEAVAQLGKVSPEKGLALGDLAKAGWEVTGPTRQADGGLVVGASHAFDDEAEARQLISDLAGADGAFRGIELAQERGFLKTTTRFSGTMDLRSGLGAFTDPDLRAALAGPNAEPLGVDERQLEERFGVPVGQIFGLKLTAGLPGRIESNSPVGAAGPTWTAAFGREVTMTASSERWNPVNIGALVTAVTAGVALIVVVIRGRRRPVATTGPG